MKNRKSFNSVRFEKGSGKNYVVKSVLSKGNADFFVEVYKMTILETKNLKKYYGKGDTQVPKRHPPVRAAAAGPLRTR